MTVRARPRATVTYAVATYSPARDRPSSCPNRTRTADTITDRRSARSVDRRRRGAMTPSLRLVAERFERLRAQGGRIFDRDENFRGLCDEYEACIGTVTRLQSCASSSEGMRNEY